MKNYLAAVAVGAVLVFAAPGMPAGLPTPAGLPAPPCLIPGPQWSVHQSPLPRRPAKVLRGRRYIVLPPTYSCAKARVVIGRMLARYPKAALSRGNMALPGAPAGWRCISAEAAAPDRRYAGLCDGPGQAFLSWEPFFGTGSGPLLPPAG